MALNMDVESDEEVLDQEPDEPDESDGEEAAMGEHLASTRAGEAEEEEEVVAQPEEEEQPEEVVPAFRLHNG